METPPGGTLVVSEYPSARFHKPSDEALYHAMFALYKSFDKADTTE